MLYRVEARPVAAPVAELWRPVGPGSKSTDDWAGAFRSLSVFLDGWTDLELAVLVHTLQPGEIVVDKEEGPTQPGRLWEARIVEAE